MEPHDDGRPGPVYRALEPKALAGCPCRFEGNLAQAGSNRGSGNEQICTVGSSTLSPIFDGISH